MNVYYTTGSTIKTKIKQKRLHTLLLSGESVDTLEGKCINGRFTVVFKALDVMSLH